MAQSGPGHKDTFVIRRMTADDRLAVADLLLVLNRVENALTCDRHVSGHAGLECLVENENRIAAHGGTVLVAEDQGQVVATLLLVSEPAEAFVRPDLRSCTRVLDLCVAASHRGRGLGRRLLDEAESIARAHGHAALLIGAVVGNETALGLYESVGFRRRAIELLKPLRPFDPGDAAS